MCHINWKFLQCMCSGRTPESPSTSLCSLVRDRSTILRNFSNSEVHYGPSKRPDPLPDITASSPHYLNPQQQLKAERKGKRCITECPAPGVGVGLATSTVVRLVVHVVGVGALGKIYKVWSDSFKGKDDLEDIDTDGRVTSSMSRLGNSCSALT